jgi:hypothetical protein
MKEKPAQPKEQKALIFRKTGITNLSREVNSGIYYLLATVNGRSHKLSMRTTDLAVAKERFAPKMAAIRAASRKVGNLRTDAQFNNPAMWRLFLRETMPELVKQLNRLNRNLENLNRDGGSAATDAGAQG